MIFPHRWTASTLAALLLALAGRTAQADPAVADPETPEPASGLDVQVRVPFATTLSRQQPIWPAPSIAPTNLLFVGYRWRWLVLGLSGGFSTSSSSTGGMSLTSPVSQSAWQLGPVIRLRFWRSVDRSAGTYLLLDFVFGQFDSSSGDRTVGEVHGAFGGPGDAPHQALRIAH
ncbi:MAG: hypothetical protein AAB131_17065, partial [Actinomycetota bacterium]